MVCGQMRTVSSSNWFSFLRRIFPRKYLFTVPFALILATPFVCAQDNVIELTNADVLAMVRDKLPADAIIKRIQISLCHFDTFPPVISELRYRGVPEEVLAAMVAAPVGRPTKPVEQTTADNKNGDTSLTRSETPPAKSPPLASPSQKTIADPSKEALNTRSPSVTQREKAAIDAMTTVTTAGKGAPLKRSTATSSEIVPIESNEASRSNQTGGSSSSTLPLPTPAEVRQESSAKEQAATLPVPKEQPNSQELTPAPRVLTNSYIVSLLREGAPLGGIVDTIKSSSGNFDLSAKALLELREAGADATVFLAMMEINQRTAEKKTTASSANSVNPPGKPEKQKD